MGTKNNPGTYDCYEKAGPDEPMFVLLARDPAAGETIRFWMAERERVTGVTEVEQIQEAMDCAQAMDDWYEENVE